MKHFEIMAAGFDGSSDQTDHHIIWVDAPAAADVHAAIAGSESTFGGEVDSSVEPDFMLPQDAAKLRARLQFFKAVRDLAAVHLGLSNGTVNALQHSRERERCLGHAVSSIAIELGTNLETALFINSNGEIPLTSTKHGGGYGQPFAELLNRHKPRCGVLPGATLLPESSWCWMNHFDVERLIHDRYANLAKAPA